MKLKKTAMIPQGKDEPTANIISFKKFLTYPLFFKEASQWRNRRDSHPIPSSEPIIGTKHYM